MDPICSLYKNYYILIVDAKKKKRNEKEKGIRVRIFLKPHVCKIRKEKFLNLCFLRDMVTDICVQFNVIIYLYKMSNIVKAK